MSGVAAPAPSARPNPRMGGAARSAATLTGFGAILLWGTLATLGASARSVPPFFLTAIAFAVASATGLMIVAARGAWREAFTLPIRAWVIGVGGIAGYHAVYFAALSLAPPVEVSLIAYLWPLLIVLFSALLPGERLRPHHLVGTGAGLSGVILLVADKPLGFDHAALPGYLLALAAALLWSGYSVLSRRFLAGVPSLSVVAYCVVTAPLTLAASLAFETRAPIDLDAWLAMIALGLGPLGAAFLLWDRGVKAGDIQVLGAGSYATPLLSTVILVAFGLAEPSWSLAAAGTLIVGGAVIAGKDALKRR